jgi:hypothetical protein
VTVVLVVRCDGTPKDRDTIALENCRAFLPTRSYTVDEARTVALGEGWGIRWDPETWPGPSKLQDLCPSCVRAITEAPDA